MLKKAIALARTLKLPGACGTHGGCVRLSCKWCQRKRACLWCLDVVQAQVPAMMGCCCGRTDVRIVVGCHSRACARHSCGLEEHVDNRPGRPSSRVRCFGVEGLVIALRRLAKTDTCNDIARSDAFGHAGASWSDSKLSNAFLTVTHDLNRRFQHMMKWSRTGRSQRRIARCQQAMMHLLVLMCRTPAGRSAVSSQRSSSWTGQKTRK